MTRITAGLGMALLASALLAGAGGVPAHAQTNPPAEATKHPVTATLPAHRVLTRHQTLIVHGRRGKPAPVPAATVTAPAAARGFHLNAGPMRKPSDCQTGYTNIGGQPARAGELYTSMGHRACQPH